MVRTKRKSLRTPETVESWSIDTIGVEESKDYVNVYNQTS